MYCTISVISLVKIRPYLICKKQNAHTLKVHSIYIYFEPTDVCDHKMHLSCQMILKRMKAQLNVLSDPSSTTEHTVLSCQPRVTAVSCFVYQGLLIDS